MEQNYDTVTLCIKLTTLSSGRVGWLIEGLATHFPSKFNLIHQRPPAMYTFTILSLSDDKQTHSQ